MTTPAVYDNSVRIGYARVSTQYVAVETLGRLQRRTAEIRDDSANTLM